MQVARTRSMHEEIEQLQTSFQRKKRKTRLFGRRYLRLYSPSGTLYSKVRSAFLWWTDSIAQAPSLRLVRISANSPFPNKYSRETVCSQTYTACSTDRRACPNDGKDSEWEELYRLHDRKTSFGRPYRDYLKTEEQINFSNHYLNRNLEIIAWLTVNSCKLNIFFRF